MGVDIRLQLVTMLPRLRRFAVSLARDRDLADDLVQATCERALRAQAGWQPGTRLDSWLYRIMQNLWIDDMRKRTSHGDEVAIEDRHDLVGEEGARSAEPRMADGAFRPASGSGAAVDAFLDGARAGDALDAAAVREQIAKGWS